MRPTLAVGIAGGSGAGKTMLAQLVAERLGPVSLLDMDSYYLDRSGVGREERDSLNFDEPAAFDIKLLIQHLNELRDGRNVEKPRYSFRDHTRIGVETVVPGPLVLVEGLFALWWEDLREQLELPIYLDAPPDVRVQRRIRRDVESRGRKVDSVLEQYGMTVGPMHERYVEPTRLHADVVLANDSDIESCLESVCTAVEGRRVGRR
jgi:uridine kinase